MRRWGYVIGSMVLSAMLLVLGVWLIEKAIDSAASESSGRMHFWGRW